MNSLLDIFGSVVIAGILFMLIMKLNLFSSQTSYASDSELKLIQNTKTLAEIIDYDLRKIGYKISGPKIVEADSNNLKFYACLDAIAPTDSHLVEYAVNYTKKANGTQNPKDIVLYRIVDGDSSGGPSLGLVRLKFSYLDSASTETSNISKIRYIKTQMWVEGSDAIADTYSDTSTYSKNYWEFTINPRNL